MADLAHAVMQGSIAAAQKIIKAGNVDINHQDKDGRTALYIAAFNGHLDMIRLLLDAGANPNLADKFKQRFVKRFIV